MSPDMMPSLGHNSTYGEFLPEMHNLNLSIMTHQTNTNQEIIYEKADLLSSKMPMSERQNIERLKSCFK